MKFLGILFVFFGYVLVYAAVAAGGKFATEPWAALFADAYTGAGGMTNQQWAQTASSQLGGNFSPLSPTPGFSRPRGSNTNTQVNWQQAAGTSGTLSPNFP